MKTQDLLEEIEGKESRENIKKVAIWLGILAYMSVVILMGLHSYNLIVNGVNENMRWVAIFGFIGLEINVIALPLAIHYWTTTSMHRWAAITFYVLDILLLYLNSTIDSALVTGGGMPPWGEWYLVNIARVSPIYSLVVWAILFMLDPSERVRHRRVAAMNKIREIADMEAIAYIQSGAFAEILDEEARGIASGVVSEAFGTERKALPKQTKKRANEDGNGKVERPKIRNF